MACTGNNPCLNGGTCTDGIGSFICDCAGTGYYGLTCEVSQAIPCVDDPVWVSSLNGMTCADFVDDIEDLCSSSWAADAAGVTAEETCPVSCQSGCALTYDDCCELSPPTIPSAARRPPDYCNITCLRRCGNRE